MYGDVDHSGSVHRPSRRRQTTTDPTGSGGEVHALRQLPSHAEGSRRRAADTDAGDYLRGECCVRLCGQKVWVFTLEVLTVEGVLSYVGMQMRCYPIGVEATVFGSIGVEATSSDRVLIFHADTGAQTCTCRLWRCMEKGRVPRMQYFAAVSVEVLNCYLLHQPPGCFPWT